jgi:TolB protein
VTIRADYEVAFNVEGDDLKLTLTRCGDKGVVLSQSPGPDDKVNRILRGCDEVVTELFRSKAYFAGQIVFVAEIGGHKEICTSDLLFRNPVQLTRHRSQTLLPKWSADGRKIMYTSYHKSGAPDVFVTDIGTRDIRAVASYKGTNSSGCFCAGGKMIVGVSAGKSSSQLHLLDTSGKMERALTNSNGHKVGPALSPDGRWMVFSWDKGNLRPQLYKLAVHVKNAVPEPVPTGLSTHVVEPCWSHDGAQIAFTVSIDRRSQIGILNCATRESCLLTSGPQHHLEGCWMADNRHLICTEKTKNEKHLCLLDTLTKKLIPLPCTLKNACQADVAPRR